MKKITTLALIGLLSVNLMACGNVKDKTKGTESAKNEKVESISDKNITTKSKSKSAKNFWQDKNEFNVEMLYAIDETFVKSKGVATIKKEKSLDSGTIFSVVVNSDDNNIKNRTMSYFYVEDEKIYVLYNYNKDKNVNKDSMQIAFQSNKLKEDDGKGLRYQITPKGNKTNFYLRTYNVETYFFNRIVWGKYRNIKSYKSGYGAGRDLLQVKFIF